MTERITDEMVERAANWLYQAAWGNCAGMPCNYQQVMDGYRALARNTLIAALGEDQPR